MRLPPQSRYERSNAIVVSRIFLSNKQLRAWQSCAIERSKVHLVNFPARVRGHFSNHRWRFLMAQIHRATALPCAKPMTEVQYVKSRGLRCPYCKSSDVEAPGSVDIDSGTATQEIRCNDCEAFWTDIYHLVGYQAVTKHSDG